MQGHWQLSGLARRDVRASSVVNGCRHTLPPVSAALAALPVAGANFALADYLCPVQLLPVCLKARLT
jgi:hypothetical protein